jgi:mono/diheme cytochrome c family protein
MLKRFDVFPLILVSVGLIVLVIAGWVTPDPRAQPVHNTNVAVAAEIKATLPPLPELKPDSVARGERIYVLHCASCHGVALEGQPNWKTPLPDGRYPSPPHDDSGHTWHHPDHLLYEIILDGGNGNPGAASNMPAFRDKLDGPQLVGVLDYIKSRWSLEKRLYQWEMTVSKH